MYSFKSMRANWKMTCLVVGNLFELSFLQYRYVLELQYSSLYYHPAFHSDASSLAEILCFRISVILHENYN